LAVGTAIVEVSQIGKVCHTRCAIYYLAGDCIFPREGIFGWVVQPGTVRVGDEVRVLELGEGDDVVMVLQTADLELDVSTGKKVNFTTQPRLIQLFDKETGNNLIWYDQESVDRHEAHCKEYNF